MCRVPCWPSGRYFNFRSEGRGSDSRSCNNRFLCRLPTPSAQPSRPYLQDNTCTADWAMSFLHICLHRFKDILMHTYVFRTAKYIVRTRLGLEVFDASFIGLSLWFNIEFSWIYHKYFDLNPQYLRLQRIKLKLSIQNSIGAGITEVLTEFGVIKHPRVLNQLQFASRNNKLKVQTIWDIVARN